MYRQHGYRYNDAPPDRHYRGHRRNRGRGQRGGRGRGHRRDPTKRAPLSHLSSAFMSDVRQKTDDNNTWDKHIDLEKRDQNDYNTQQTTLQASTSNPLRIRSNIYPVHLSDSIVVHQYAVDNIDAALLRNKANMKSLRVNKHIMCYFIDKPSNTLYILSTQSEHNIDVSSLECNITKCGSYNMNQFANISENESESHARIPQTNYHQHIYEKIIKLKFRSHGLLKVMCGAYLYKNGDVHHIHNISYLHGFRAVFTHTFKAPFIGIKLSSYYQYVSSATVREYLRDGKESEVVGRKALVMYSLETVTIKGIEVSKTERDIAFDDTTFAEYLSQKYGLRDIKPERHGLIQVENRSKEIIYYLPQFLRLKIKSNEPDALVAGLTLSKQKKEQFEARTDLVKRLSHDHTLFTIDEEPIVTDGFILQDPQIKMHIRGKEQVMNMTQGLKDWRYISGTIDSKKHIVQWNIHIYGMNHGANQNLQRNVTGYISKRSFGRFFRDVRCFDDIGIENIVHDTTEHTLVFVVISSDVEGSQLKRTLHAAFKAKGILSQFIEEYTVSNAVKVYGAMDDCMFKIGESLYAIECNHKYKEHLILGFDVNHSTMKERPSIAVMCGIRTYYVPKQKRINGCTTLLNHRQEIPSASLAKQMALNVLTSQLKRMKTLPKAVWYIRDGVSESQLDRLNNTEVMGVKAALVDIKKNAELVKFFGDELVEWAPKVEIVVIQKRIHDDFCAMERLKRDANTYIVPFDVVQANKLDLYIKKGNQHPLRVLFLQDDLEFMSRGNIMEACQFFLDLLFTFPYGMPNGSTAVPSPIKWSDKWAQQYQELISEKHRNVKDVAKFLNLEYIAENSQSDQLNRHNSRKRRADSDLDNQPDTKRRRQSDHDMNTSAVNTNTNINTNSGSRSTNTSVTHRPRFESETKTKRSRSRSRSRNRNRHTRGHRHGDNRDRERRRDPQSKRYSPHSSRAYDRWDGGRYERS
eukprot:205605_1